MWELLYVYTKTDFCGYSPKNVHLLQLSFLHYKNLLYQNLLSIERSLQHNIKQHIQSHGWILRWFCMVTTIQVEFHFSNNFCHSYTQFYPTDFKTTFWIVVIGGNLLYKLHLSAKFKINTCTTKTWVSTTQRMFLWFNVSDI